MRWIDVAGLDALPEGGVLGIEVEGTPVALVLDGGRLYALHDCCTHHEALLSDGYVEDGCLECPLHQGRFCLRTGAAVDGPVERPVVPTSPMGCPRCTNAPSATCRLRRCA